MKDHGALKEDNIGVRALCLEARHTISLEVAKERRQKFESGIFIPKYFSQHINPFKMATENDGLLKPNGGHCRAKYKSSVKRSFTLPRRQKELLERRRLEHPECYPLPKKQVANKFNSVVKNNIEESTMAQMEKLKNQNQIKNIDLRENHKFFPSSESLRSVRKYHTKYLMEASNQTNKKNDLSLSNSTISTYTELPSLSPSHTSSINSIEFMGQNNQNVRNDIQTMPYKEPAPIAVPVPMSYELNGNISADLRLNQIIEEPKVNLVWSTKMDHLKNQSENSIRESIESNSWMERPIPSLMNEEENQSNKDCSSQQTELFTNEEPAYSQPNYEYPEIGNEPARLSTIINSANELLETQNSQKIINDNEYQRFDDSIHSNNAKTNCQCCFHQENIVVHQERIPPTNSYSNWPQITNRNKETFYPNRFCGPAKENGRCFGYCCAGPPGIPATIPPQILQLPAPSHIPTMPPPSNIFRPPIIKDHHNFNRTENQWNENNRFHMHGPTTEWTRFKHKSQIYRTPCPPTQHTQPTKYLFDFKMPIIENAITQLDPSSSHDIERLPFLDRQSLSILKRNPNTQHTQLMRLPQQMEPISHTRSPYFGCNMCPPYPPGPWCFPWWYTNFPPNGGYDQLYSNAMGAAYNPTSYGPQTLETP